jgi:Amt family ammonium transporter
LEWLHRKKPTALGVASGLVAGLVAITPAAGYVAPLAAIALGVIAAGVCYLAVLAKNRLGYDDSLDAFGIHGVGGLAGALLTGVFAQKALNEGGADGAMFGGSHQLGVQAIACAATGVYAVVCTFGILKLIDATIGLRVSKDDEREGLDAALHGEDAYGASTGQLTEEESEGPALQPARADEAAAE